MSTKEKTKEVNDCHLISAKISNGFQISLFTIEDYNETEIPHEPNEKAELKSKGFFQRYAGIGFAISCSIVFSLGSVVIKTMQSYHAFNLSTWRFQGVLIPNIIILAYYWATGKSEVVKNVWPLKKEGAKRNLAIVILRGILGGGLVIFQIYSLQYLNLGDSTVIVFSSPVFVAYLAHFILGEALGIIPVITSLFTLGGVVVITRPPFLAGGELSMDNLIGIGMALCSMSFGAGTVIVLRFLKDVHTTLITTAFGSVGTIFCVALAFGFQVFELPQGRDDWIFAIALGVTTFLGQILFTLALQYEEAGPVSLIRSGDVIFSFIWQFIFLGIQPDIFSIIGASIVLTGVLIIGTRKWIQSLPEGNPTRNRFHFLLL